MKLPEPITWTCAETGLVARFEFSDPSGWAVSFPNHSIKMLRVLKQKGIELPWPEVPDEWKPATELCRKRLLSITRGDPWE